MCDDCIGGTVGCVLKISHTQQPVPSLQREITQLCRQREGGKEIKEEEIKEGRN